MAEEPPMKKQMTAKYSAQRIELPGFGLELEQESDIPIALDWHASPTTVKERAMIGLMLALKDKPNWDRKVFDEEIVAKWRKEATAWRLERGSHVSNFGGSGTEDNPWNGATGNGENIDVDGEQIQKDITEKDFDYCIAELRDNAQTYQERGFTEAIDASVCVYMSDTAVSSETKARLKRSVAPLENVKPELKDWHPGSDGKVLDLVHPSLFPLVYGRSRILPDRKVSLEDCSLSIGEGEIIPEAPNGAEFGRYSDDFQWLPCEVALNSDNQAKITSYINNLHPGGNENLYRAIEDVITASVPMWLQTILSTQFLVGSRVKNDFDDGYVNLPENECLDGCDEDNCQDGYHYLVAVPEPKDFQPRHRVPRDVFELPGSEKYRASDLSAPVKDSSNVPDPAQVELDKTRMRDEVNRWKKVFADQGLQVIVKLANIHLTPEKPTYDGGSWHIEGQLNEHICASALYYYDSDNITDSYLAFREGVDRDEIETQQDRYSALMEIYGIKDSWGSAIQVLGSVHTREDRLLVFPNVWQHRVSPFSLQDKTRPGHRKILALFLVDPDIRIPSTANVPPQQRHWWKKAMEEKGSLIQRLPVELADQVVDNVEDFPITIEEAKGIRERLMDERRTFVDSTMQEFEDNGYCFCEH
ncbi:hypothetical protein HII31_13497 [Pseudocercospora fuligena]|uniref:Uncharacterized protein n=1 Tax=Pseudocercospora fuligena TaxID=685502 RepID=A0A8H6R7D9_9PEZI|nr:hypothetical protein HII31_13497 [Pseudocercospora fuligena]